MKKITVIGAGLSGTLLIINLLKRDSKEPVNINWIDCNSEREMGFAYSTNEDYLLNVPVELMGAFSEDPESFLRWSQKRMIGVKKGAYLPRRLYREYILDILNSAVESKKDNIHLKRIRDTATHIGIENKSLKINLCNFGTIVSEKVILAIGNPLPGNPVVGNKDYIRDSRYSQNPWNPEILEHISEYDTLLFIGSGQTMVDLVTGLFRNKHKGKLIAISRMGLLPMAQKEVAPYPSFYHELKGLTTIISVFQVVHKHLKIAENNHLDQRSVIDSIRPYTSAVWMNLPTEEKQRFLRHLFRFWEIIRSRIPPASEEIINELTGSGQLQIIAGRINEIHPALGSMKIDYVPRGSKDDKTVSVHKIINCKGPDLDYDRNDQPLIKNLLSAKLIECDPVHLGINALPEGPVLTDGNASDVIYTIGPPLKGIVWESIAAPEIRVQAENLSRLVCEN